MRFGWEEKKLIDPDSFWGKYGAKTILYVVGVGLFVVLGLAVTGSSGTLIKNTDVGIIVNNVTGDIQIHQNGGMVMHMPLGLTSVYTLDKSQRILRLTREVTTRQHPEGEQIALKTNDGTNIEIDVEIVYQVIPELARTAYSELVQSSDAQNMEEILRAFVRSDFRNRFGELSTLEIIDPTARAGKLALIQDYLAMHYKKLGVEVVSVTALNFRFDPEYEKLVKDRKEAEQILANQKDYQDQAREEGKRMVAEATRDRETAIAQLQGESAKRILTADGEAKRLLLRAQQQAYQEEREGDIALKTAEQEATAVQAEGERKAEGMAKLLDAYEKGGEGLVKEALAKLYEGVTIKSRPYSQSDRIEQFIAVPSVPGREK